MYIYARFKKAIKTDRMDDPNDGNASDDDMGSVCAK